MKHLLTLAFASICFLPFCQSKEIATLKIRIVEMPQKHLNDTLFIAGNFNGWNAHDNNTIMLPRKDGSYEKIVSVNNKEIVEWKITRGNWNNVEVDINGNDMPNHSQDINGPSTQNIIIKAWKDDFLPKEKTHTASLHVHIIDTAFNLRALGKTRRIWVYLPSDYFTSNKRYPVLYMHDGQNLFDTFTSSYGEWGIDEIMDTVFDKTKKGLIIVGIDNGSDRMLEYNPYGEKQEGKAYVQSLVESLKPFIDKRFRTLKDGKNTSIAGSSMGGIISLWAVMQYPKIFGSAGIFSPAFWVAPQYQKDVLPMMKNYNGKLFFYAGGNESKTMVSDMDTIINKLKTLPNIKITEQIVPQEQHNEAAWNKAFPSFLKMLF